MGFVFRLTCCFALLIPFSLWGQDTVFLKPSTIFIAGDSTAATYSSEQQQGWGMHLATFFNSNKVTVDNRARGGRSSRTFITQGWWDKLIEDVKPGDIVLIQFGHNDASPVNDDRRARGTLAGIDEKYVEITNLLTGKLERVHTFGHYITKMVKDVRAKQGVPVLLSLTVRNIWHAEHIERGSGQYGGWMHSLAMTLNTPYIDVTNLVADKLIALGKDKTAQLYPKDHTHFNRDGALIHAEAVVSALKGLRPSLNPALFSSLGNSVEKQPWTFVNLPVVTNKSLQSVFMVGDSTVRNGRGNGANGEWGWGDFIKDHVSLRDVNIVNRAVGGFSSRTYITQGLWQQSLNMMTPGDIVLIQFGHNDAGALNDDSRARGTIAGVGARQEVIDNMLTGKREVVHTYGWYLRKMIGEAKAKGVIPIVCSPVPRKKWSEDGLTIMRKPNSYPEWAEQVARQSRTMFFDLHSLVAQEYDKLGQGNVDRFFADKHTHTSLEGAKFTADIVASRLSMVLGR